MALSGNPLLRALALGIAVFVLSARAWALPATLTTQLATNVAETSATLNGVVNPRGEATTAWFRIATSNPGTCNDLFGTRVPSSGGTDVGSGSSGVPYSATASGLVSGTLYYYCAIASNPSGTSYGSVSLFTALGTPVVVTGAAFGMTAASATISATANPKGALTTGWFRYSTADPGSCDDTFGTRAPASGGSTLGSGGLPASFSQSLSGLSPGTTYYYCAVASNSVGTGFGVVNSFTTQAAPSVTSGAVTSLDITSAMLNATATPNGVSTRGWFRYATTDPGTCSDTFGTRIPATLGTALGIGYAPVAYAQSLYSLLPGTTYYYCAIASNAIGTSLGAVLTFTTPAGAPVVTTNMVGALTDTTVNLQGTANPRAAAATGYFRFGTTHPGACTDAFGTRVPGSGGTDLGSANGNSSYSEALSGLTPGATYYYCAAATNAVGTTFGIVVSFTMATAPVVATSGVLYGTGTTVTLVGVANPSGSLTTAWFRYSTTNPGTCDDTFGTKVTSTLGTVTGYANHPFYRVITGLPAGTKYYYCAIAANSIGLSFGNVVPFTTTTTPPPVVTTETAANVSDVGATLRGFVTANGALTIAWFQYDTFDPGTCSSGFGQMAPSTTTLDVGTGTSPAPVNLDLLPLAPGRYYYCAVAFNGAATVYGNVVSFDIAGGPGGGGDAGDGGADASSGGGDAASDAESDAIAVADAASNGGTTGAGGATATDGATSTGGAVGTGGTTGTGGAFTTGGTTGAGGAPGAGGMIIGIGGSTAGEDSGAADAEAGALPDAATDVDAGPTEDARAGTGGVDPGSGGAPSGAASGSGGRAGTGAVPGSAGTGNSSGQASAGGASADAAVPDASTDGARSGDTGGCGCQLGTKTPSSWRALGVLLLFAVRRRRRAA